MSTHNLVRFYHNEYGKARQNWRRGEHDLAEDQCCELLGDYQCPRLLQVQAWQLRSLCTSDYWLAESHLEAALNLIDSLDGKEDAVLVGSRAHTVAMLEELEAEWVKHWAALGQTPPTEQRIEDTYVAVGPIDKSGDAGAGDAGDVPSAASTTNDVDAARTETQSEKVEVDLPLRPK